MAEVTTSIVVQFSTTGSSGILTAEIDSREAGFNSGKTSFQPGDQPAFLIYKSADVTIQSIEPSAGNIADLGAGLEPIEELLTFANATEATLQKPISGALTYKWLGNNLGAPVVVGDNLIRVPTKGVGVLKVNYNAPWLAKRLSGLPTVLNGETEYSVLIVITGTK